MRPGANRTMAVAGANRRRRIFMNHSNEALVGRFYLHHAKSGTTRHVNATGYVSCECRNGRTCVHALRMVKGSRAAKKAQKGFLISKEYVRIREDLIENGTLIDQGNFHEFTRDYTFRSSSAASCVIRADSSNGPLQWKCASDRTSDGKALREILCEIDGQEYIAAA